MEVKNEPRVFCVGFQKTGTSSLGKALEILGHKVAGYWEFRDLAQDTGNTWEKVQQRAATISKDFTAYQDTPWPLLYQEMDQLHPNSKFILVLRDSDKWIASAVKDFDETYNKIHLEIYGTAYPRGNEASWIKRYEQHNLEVQKYFKERKDDLLVLRLDQGECNWENLCRFLGRDIPDTPWPHVNKIHQKKRMLRWIRIKDKFKGLFA